MRLQSVIGGFQGVPVTLIGVLDEKTGVLIVAKEIGFREDRAAADLAMITDLELEGIDFRFTDKHIKDAIRSYFARKAQGTLDFEEGLGRFQPDNKIEQDGVDDGGRKFRVAPDVTNGQMAVLSMVAFVDKQRSIGMLSTMADDITDMYRAFTI